MYLLAFTYWTTVLAGQFRTLHNLRANAATTLSLVSPLDCFLILSTKEGTALPAHCATIPDVSEFVAIAPTWDFTQECAGTVALAINVRVCAFFLAWDGMGLTLTGRWGDVCIGDARGRDRVVESLGAVEQEPAHARDRRRPPPRYAQ